MNFRLAYEQLCRRHKAKNKKTGIATTKAYKDHRWIDGKEVHHVLPKVLGGRNTASNFIALYPNEHAYAYVMLNLAFA